MSTATNAILFAPTTLAGTLDGRVMYDMFLMQVKTPEESTYPWDYVKAVQRVPADQAFTSKAESTCMAGK